MLFLTGGVLLLLSAALPDAAGPKSECARWWAAFAAMPARTVGVETPAGRSRLSVRLAATPEQQAAGLQCATPAEVRDTLILFDFGRPIVTQFHMRNVPAALDIVFATADGEIFEILRMEPSPTALYGPLRPFRYALEARAGFFAAKGIRAGATRLLAPDR